MEQGAILGVIRRSSLDVIFHEVLHWDHWYLEGGSAMMWPSHIGRLHVMGISYEAGCISISALQSEYRYSINTLALFDTWRMRCRSCHLALKALRRVPIVRIHGH